MVTEYVVGFAHDDERVALIRKNRPEWQVGYLNGIGGHIEDFDASPHAAQVREFEEETGAHVDDWQHFLTLRGIKAIIYCFAARPGSEVLDSLRTTTDEEIVVIDFDDIEAGTTVPNLEWIIPMMRQRYKYFPVVVTLTEMHSADYRTFRLRP